MRCLSDPESPKVREMLRSAERRALAAKGSYLAGMVTALDNQDDLLRRGYHMVAVGMDLALSRMAVVQDVNKFKKAAVAVAAGKGEECVKHFQSNSNGNHVLKSNNGGVGIGSE